MVKNSKDYFYYFAYGSNLFKKRILINNPSAVFAAIGQLKNHKLDFAKYNSNWQGAVSTIVPVDKEIVWGAIWKLHTDNIVTLDTQEGVKHNEYFSKTVNIKANSTTVECRTYEHTFKPEPLKSLEELPESRRPSISYITCLIMGAIECNLPTYYINILKKVPHNDRHASPHIRQLLGI